MRNINNFKSVPGSISAEVVLLDAADFLLSDRLDESSLYDRYSDSEDETVIYKIYVKCINVKKYTTDKEGWSHSAEHSGLNDECCWGFVYKKKENKVRFRGWNQGNDDIFIPYSSQGKGIGTVVFSLLIRAMKEFINENSTVRSLLLSAVDAQSESRKKRRNKFYKNFAFLLELDEEQKTGYADIKYASHLQEYYPSNKSLSFMSLADYIKEKQFDARSYKDRIKSLEDSVEFYKKENERYKKIMSGINPVHWLKMFVYYAIVAPLIYFDKIFSKRKQNNKES